MSIFIISLCSIFIFIFICYEMFSGTGENAFLEPSEWVDKYDTHYRIVHLPYGYIIEYAYEIHSLSGEPLLCWHHYTEETYNKEHIWKHGTPYIVDSFKTYEDAKKWLMNNKQFLKYEHL